VSDPELHYEIHGSGAPLVLLHGALSTIETSCGAVLPLLAKKRRVIAVEQQAHGQTPDVDRPLSYGQMTADTVRPGAEDLTRVGGARFNRAGLLLITPRATTTAKTPG
jgi:pimeloyl-ACP methyl ester carboxylesterase